jgi:hypothetical protein
MSLFLVVYDRKLHRLRELREYDASQRLQALTERLKLEILGGSDLEVVILEAESREQLESTHARYFGSDALDHLARARRSA